MTTLIVKDLEKIEDLDFCAMASVCGGQSLGLASGGSDGTAYRPGTQADINILSTSLFGGPLFPGLEPEFPG